MILAIAIEVDVLVGQKVKIVKEVGKVVNFVIETRLVTAIVSESEEEVVKGFRGGGDR